MPDQSSSRAWRRRGWSCTLSPYDSCSHLGEIRRFSDDSVVYLRRGEHRLLARAFRSLIWQVWKLILVWIAALSSPAGPTQDLWLAGIKFVCHPSRARAWCAGIDVYCILGRQFQDQPHWSAYRWYDVKKHFYRMWIPFIFTQEMVQTVLWH